ncbi:unnamed protein product, partial [marine sediment metagenome]
EDVKVKDIIIKCCILKNVSLEEHLESFNPDKKILVLRNPYHNYSSLEKKEWANRGGAINEKFELLEEIFKNREKFDLVILYEDFVLNPLKFLMQIEKLDFGVEKEFFEFKRTRKEIFGFNLKNSEWCKKRQWRFGNIHGDKIDTSLVFKQINLEDKEKIKKLCPSLCEFYETKNKS